MPVFNGASFVGEAIQSILAQTFRDFEFLIINDGSTDRSVDIINAFNDSRIRLIHNELNLGLIDTLNKGLQLARGEYIARMDADDISLPVRLERQIAYLDSNIEVGVCGTGIRYFGADDAVWLPPEKDSEIRSLLIFNSTFAHPTVVFRKSYLDKNHLRYNPENVHAEDYGLWVASARYMKFANINEILLLYRLHETSASRSNQSAQQKSADLIREKILKDMQITLTQEMMVIHQSISKWEFIISKQYITESCAWLNKLCEVNRTQSFFPEPEFSKILAERWYRICRKGQKLGLWTWKKFWNSPLSHHIHVSLKNNIGFWLKSFLRMGC